MDSIVDQVPEGAPPGVAELMRIEREEELPHLILEEGDDFEMVDETVSTLAAENAKLKEEVEEAVLRIKAYQEQLARLQSLEPLRNKLATSERFKEALVRHIREN